MTLRRPEVVHLDDDDGNAAEYQAYVEAMDRYMFKTSWLAIALSKTEFEHTIPMPVALLIELYPDIYAEGPMGHRWYTQLRRMRAILNLERKDVDPDLFLKDLASTYENCLLPYLYREGTWETLSLRAKMDWNGSAMTPDLVSYVGGPPAEVIETYTLDRLGLTKPDLREKYLDVLEDHAQVTLLEYLLRDIPDLTPVLVNHHAFIAHYALLPVGEINA